MGQTFTRFLFVNSFFPALGVGVMFDFGMTELMVIGAVALVCIGAVGEDGADPEDAKDAARVCALNALAAAASVAGGIDNLAGVVKVVGFVSSRPDFYGQAGVINGASELFGEIFGSQHARSAVGVAALPLNVSVEVEAEFLIK